MNYIDTDSFSNSLRDKAINTIEKTILITNFENSDQEKDLTEPPNCNGYGRIRHFRLGDSKDWPLNPLPILPAQKALGIETSDMIRAQVFQNAVCNWRCWYCFVDFKLLSGNRKYSEHLNCDTLLDYYCDQEAPPLVIDLTGGQPDITPEWVPWMMEAYGGKHLAVRQALGLPPPYHIEIGDPPNEGKREMQGRGGCLKWGMANSPGEGPCPDLAPYAMPAISLARTGEP